MTQGFYEQLGVSPDAELDTVRSAFHRQVARLGKRLKQLRDQGGDTSQLDLARAQLDEAWAVLSVPSRRQRYDAMLDFVDSDPAPGVDAEQLWDAVGDSLVPPSVSAAVAAVRTSTQLSLPDIGRSQVPEPQAKPMFTEASTSPTLTPETLTSAPTEALEDIAPIIPVPRPRPVAKLHAVDDVPSHLKVVDGTPQASSVIVLPPDAPRQKTLTPDQVGELTDTHGYSGGLIRAVREAKGVSLDEVAASTRISVRYLEAIEADAHDRLPSATFVKGYVREVARLLKLDDESVVTGYMRRLQQ